jgi:hypothetical protein
VNYLQKLLDLFRPSTVDAALGAFNKSLANLQRIEEKQRDEAMRQLDLERVAAVARNKALSEATRARNVADRLVQLVNPSF